MQFYLILVQKIANVSSIYALALRAATPGRTLPSRSSREAPPPVEMWDILSATFAFSTAATESPPPMMVVAPTFDESSASALATPNVPFENLSNSKTPIGPFQMTVLQSPRAAMISSVAFGPWSSPIHPSGISAADTTLVSASAANLSASTTSVGRMSSTPFSLAMRSRSFASSSLSSSTREDPTSSPRALRKVKTIPPPMMSLSTFSRRVSITPILEETLDPPTIAANGRAGSATAP
mmetsp:Transcript_22683/g.33824  ORF Transcript_22683/g.33824 Transcript_22683/m.33824 type:complete len:238 (+) Transcript_22683:237-950(+)